MSQIHNACRFTELHVKGAPLLLYNAWDAGSAKAILAAGGRASDRDEQLVRRGGARLSGRRGHPDRFRRANRGADRGERRRPGHRRF